jgi:hypothetical protein
MKIYYSVDGIIVNEYFDNLINTKYFLLTTEKLKNNKIKKKLIEKKKRYNNKKYIHMSKKFHTN